MVSAFRFSARRSHYILRGSMGSIQFSSGDWPKPLETTIQPETDMKAATHASPVPAVELLLSRTKLPCGMDSIAVCTMPMSAIWQATW